MKPIVLASSSPRRKELLEQYKIPYIVDFEEIDEVLDENLALLDKLAKLAVDKGILVAARHPQEVVVSGDTLVCYNEQMLGKANCRQEAKEMLQMLSGKKQTVYTAVAIFKNNTIESFVDGTDVYFKELQEHEIDTYLDTNEWIGKAGAYAIQGIGACLVDHIKGNIETVIGFPVYRLVKYLDM